ncbi:hypothetical protein HPB51_027266 [Rhipicephalus microplus]|uniref:Tetraspanin n=1 Tax=Rhipicephalus microplus TaxID=6941 RepID=A0A9J6D0M9_RHIMP|nr:hypothetical protein HPB51_027266 [Rhipicephalus microplus]
MDRDSVRLFSKPTTSAGISPTGTRAGPSSTGKMPTEIASAKAGAASRTFPTAMTSRGPGVMSQAPVIGRANGVVRTGVGPAAKGPAIPGGNATVTQNPGVAPAAAPATAVGAVPTSYGPAFAVGQTAQPASANSFTIGPGPGFPVAEIGASRGVPKVGTGAPMPFSPVLESALFADSEGDEEPDYELSDTTILDVNPYLLLPLSGCNFFFIAASVLVFLGALYAYFDQVSTPTATSANTWLVYLLLHLEIVLMVLSLGVFIVASIGFIGALRENIELLDLYTTLQGSFVTTEAVFIVMLFFLPIIGREFVISHITTEFIVHYRDKLDYQREIDYVQSSLHCCGMTDNSYGDWNANPYFNCSPTNPSAERCSVPPS